MSIIILKCLVILNAIAAGVLTGAMIGRGEIKKINIIVVVLGILYSVGVLFFFLK
jgi:hypothetical protein